MYHPEMMLNIAHKREAELIRDAEQCGVPKTKGDRKKLAQALVALAPVAVWILWMVAAH